MTKRHQAINALIRKNVLNEYWGRKDTSRKEECSIIIKNHNFDRKKRSNYIIKGKFIKWQLPIKHGFNPLNKFSLTKIVKKSEVSNEPGRWSLRVRGYPGIIGRHLCCKTCSGYGYLQESSIDDQGNRHSTTECPNCSGHGYSTFIVL